MKNDLNCHPVTSLQNSSTRATPRLHSTLLLALLSALTILANPSALAQTFSVLYAFKGTDGFGPRAGLVRDGAGNLYGTTELGGGGDGEVFKLDKTNSLTQLHVFSSGTGGLLPFSQLARDSNGNLYGTTELGGSSNAGTVFKLDKTNHETILYNFTGGTDGGQPVAGLVRDAKGNLYGTTSSGGAASGLGVIFKVTPSKHETVLHTFTGKKDGAQPMARLVMDSTGNLYGTAAGGGTAGSGVVFKLDTANHFTVLHSFSSGKDGAIPMADLIIDTAGNLYGTTFAGGANSLGIIFKLSPTGKETRLYTFVAAKGGAPAAGLVQDTAGNLYGTTEFGGSANGGVVFKLNTGNNVSVLHDLCSEQNCADGEFPVADLILDSKGSLYGTASAGGTGSSGIVFKVAP
jgi:uncharacterized repeat protein (TIGR03803 family)